MPRPALARTTFMAASVASGSVLASLASAGYVPAGAEAAQMTVGGEVLTEVASTPGGPQDPGAVWLFLDTKLTASDGTSALPFNARSEEPDPLTHSSVRTGVAEDIYRDIVFDGPVPIPLPAALWTGMIGLGAVAWAKRRLARS